MLAGQSKQVPYDLPSSPAHVMATLIIQQKNELDAIIQELEEENR